MTTSQPRRVRVDDRGVPFLSYVEGRSGDRPWADRIDPLVPDAAALAMARMPGWAMSCPEPLGRELHALGAKPTRHCHRMSRDLLAHPPPGEWADQPLRTIPCGPSIHRAISAWRAAYPPGHPDHRPKDNEALLKELFHPLLDGTLHGPSLPCSCLVVDEADQVVAGLLVNDIEGDPPYGGPWITELFRDPDPRHRGLGRRLLRRAISATAADGRASLGLVVTEGNPARGLYEAHGFRLVDSTITVIIPD